MLTRKGVWGDDDIQLNALLGKFTTGELKEETNANKKYITTVVFRSGYLRHRRCTSVFDVLYLNSSKAQLMVTFYAIYFILLAPVRPAKCVSDEFFDVPGSANEPRPV
jgi:hypothetical protein